MNLFYLETGSTDPRLNLALEQVAFDRLDRDKCYFMLWQNDNAIIVGKHQNTIAEINEPYVRGHGVRVVRRLSGGGAVYHDLGNLNFTFIADSSDAAKIDFALFCEPVAKALAALGVHAQLTGRNDLTIAGQKFSGNAQYLREGRVMHHGTILFDSDLDAVSHALRVPAAKIESKGVPSVRSRVTNVRPHLPRDVTLAEFWRLLVRSVFGEGPVPTHRFTPGDLAAAETLVRERYGTWEWNYGASPPCSLVKAGRIEGCGTLELRFDVRAGRIAAAQLYGDFFSVRDPQELTARFIGFRPDAESFRQALGGVDAGAYVRGLTNEALLALL